MTAAGHGAAEERYLSIGGVIDLLSPEFPDLTVSKVRFLENEGLVTPERTASGYRRFSAADGERLRYVLTAQRDRYLPLKVIKKRTWAGLWDNAAATWLAKRAKWLG